MKKYLLFGLILTLGIYANSGFKDSDMDGVADSRDKCLSTPFFDLVDSKGCTVKTLASKDSGR